MKKLKDIGGIFSEVFWTFFAVDNETQVLPSIDVESQKGDFEIQ